MVVADCFFSGCTGSAELPSADLAGMVTDTQVQSRAVDPSSSDVTPIQTATPEDIREFRKSSTMEFIAGFGECQGSFFFWDRIVWYFCCGDVGFSGFVFCIFFSSSNDDR